MGLTPDRDALGKMAVLENWALPILQDEEDASREKLKEIILLRDALARLDVSRPIEFRLLQFDKKFDPWQHTLLYLPDEEALALDVEHVTCWHGIHRWALVRGSLPFWTRQVSEAMEEEVHRAEVFGAVRKMIRENEAGFARDLLGGHHATWKKRLDEPEVQALRALLEG